MTDDISAGGFCIKAGRQVFEQGTQDLKIYFPFQNFAFHLQLKAKPVYYNQILNTVGFTFTEIDSRQLSLLNLVIKSSLSGEIANDGQIMEVLKQNDVPKVDLYPHNKWSRFVPLGLIVLAGVTGLILLAGSIYENTSIVKSYMAVIEADTYTVSAAGDGVYDSLLAVGAQKVTKGQELAVLKPQSSEPENISASAVTGEADTPPGYHQRQHRNQKPVRLRCPIKSLPKMANSRPWANLFSSCCHLKPIAGLPPASVRTKVIACACWMMRMYKSRVRINS